MYEKVNPMHPDKIADRIAGAVVDLAYASAKEPKIAVEVMIGHGHCNIIAETSVPLFFEDVRDAVIRITGQPKTQINFKLYRQDAILAGNQVGKIRCGDNGIFKGAPVTNEQRELTQVAKELYERIPQDGKYIIDKKAGRLIICQSNATDEQLHALYPDALVNPLGYWTGGVNVDTGATNRKLGSDMGDSMTGGGLHGKDLSKADVSVNIYAFLKAQSEGREISLECAIGDEQVDGKPYREIVDIARAYIEKCGGFEKFAEWGLIR